MFPMSNQPTSDAPNQQFPDEVFQPFPVFLRQDDFDAAWLAQFTPLDNEMLTGKQRQVVEQFRQTFPHAKVGRRDTRISVYVIDPRCGPVAADLPRG